MEILEEAILRFNTFINGFTASLITLSFAIFFFAYRERKDVAYSLFKKSASTKIISPIFIWSTVFLFIKAVFFPHAKNLNLDALSVISFFINLIWLSSAVYAYWKIISLININKTFDKSLNEVNKNLNKINNYKENYLQEHTISPNLAKKTQKAVTEINVNLEIAFQILLSKKKFNLSNDFSNSLKQLDQKAISHISKINNDEKYFSFIVPYSGDSYKELLSITLKGISDLLEVSCNNENQEDINLLVESFVNTKPLIFNLDKETDYFWRVTTKSEFSLGKHFTSLYDQYYIASYKVINILSQSNNGRTTSVLKKLFKSDKQSSLYGSKNDLLTLTAALLINAIEDNNLKQLTDTMNVLMDETLKFSQSKMEKSHRRINVGAIQEKIRASRASEEDAKYKIYTFIFLAIVKAIELGRYNCAGFLIKNSVKNFDFNKFSFTIKLLNNTLQNPSPDLKLSKRLSTVLPLNYSFSKSSYEYCFKKSLLLLNYQRDFTKIMKLNHVGEEHNFIEIDKMFENNRMELSYINDKLEGLNKEYGLLFLEKDKFEAIRNKAFE